MPEFHYTQTVISAMTPALNSKSLLVEPFRDVFLYSKFIRRIGGKGDNKSDTSSTFGVYRSPQEFLRDAKLVKHPFDTTGALPDAMLRALATILREGPIGVMKHRLKVLQTWNDWKRELQPLEHKLHDSLPVGVAKVLQGTKLWKELRSHWTGLTAMYTLKFVRDSNSLATLSLLEFSKQTSSPRWKSKSWLEK